MGVPRHLAGAGFPHFAVLRGSFLRYATLHSGTPAAVLQSLTHVVQARILRKQINTILFRAGAIQSEINKQAADGWKFEQYETIIGRCCLVFQRYKCVICFSKANTKSEELIENIQLQNEQSEISLLSKKIVAIYFIVFFIISKILECLLLILQEP